MTTRRDIARLKDGLPPGVDDGVIGVDLGVNDNSTNVYKIWAGMIAFDHSDVEDGSHAFCAFAVRRKNSKWTKRLFTPKLFTVARPAFRGAAGGG